MAPQPHRRPAALRRAGCIRDTRACRPARAGRRVADAGSRRRARAIHRARGRAAGEDRYPGRSRSKASIRAIPRASNSVRWCSAAGSNCRPRTGNSAACRRSGSLPTAAISLRSPTAAIGCAAASPIAATRRPASPMPRSRRCSTATASRSQARGWYDTEALAEDGGFAYVALERVHRILKFDYRQARIAGARRRWFRCRRK